MKSRWMTTLLSVAALSGCIESFEPEVGELTAGTCKNEDSDPEVEVSFDAQVKPLLQGGCGCHSPLPPMAGQTSTGGAIDSTGFSVGDYAAIRRGGQNSRDKIVIPGDPCGSFLVQKLSDAPPIGARMPTFGPYFGRAEMNLLRDWIAEGARAN